MLKRVVACLFGLWITSCQINLQTNQSHEDEEATTFLRTHQPNVFVKSTTFTDYISIKSLKTSSTEVLITGWSIHPIIDSSMLAFQWASSSIAKSLIQYCKSKNLEPDTIKVKFRNEGNFIQHAYDADLIYPTETLEQKIKLFIEALREQNRDFVDKHFTSNVPANQNREKLLSDFMRIGITYPLSNPSFTFQLLGFSFPYATSNMDLYEFSYLLTNPNLPNEFFKLDILVSGQYEGVYHLSLKQLN